jgi:hypothetical protein
MSRILVVPCDRADSKTMLSKRYFDEAWTKVKCTTGAIGYTAKPIIIVSCRLSFGGHYKFTMPDERILIMKPNLISPYYNDGC